MLPMRIILSAPAQHSHFPSLWQHILTFSAKAFGDAVGSSAAPGKATLGTNICWYPWSCAVLTPNAPQLLPCAKALILLKPLDASTLDATVPCSVDRWSEGTSFPQLCVTSSWFQGSATFCCQHNTKKRSIFFNVSLLEVNSNKVWGRGNRLLSTLLQIATYYSEVPPSARSPGLGEPSVSTEPHTGDSQVTQTHTCPQELTVSR